MYLVTGAAGFIGSNIIRALNKRGIENIIAVDNLENGRKFSNLSKLKILDYIDKENLISELDVNSYFSKIETVFHQGACSDTTEWNGRFIMENNFSYSKKLLNFFSELGIPFIYASSASVYGVGNSFVEKSENEMPVNVYAYSKLLFDQYVRRKISQVNSRLIGLRYFNVFGPGERHKGQMASVIFHFNNQIIESGRIRIFGSYNGYEAGFQSRDYIFVDDVVDVNIWFSKNNATSGIYNVGSGKSLSFNQIAEIVLEYHGGGEIEYIPFPASLKGCYQSFTKADLTGLREVGYVGEATDLKQAIISYLDWLNLGKSDSCS